MAASSLSCSRALTASVRSTNGEGGERRRGREKRRERGDTAEGGEAKAGKDAPSHEQRFSSLKMVIKMPLSGDFMVVSLGFRQGMTAEKSTGVAARRRRCGSYVIRRRRSPREYPPF